jgi:4a-hydroxytetrahydrobiopterin dehydratase
METNIKSYFSNHNWTLVNENRKAKKSFKFKKFTEAFAWMTEVAFEAEKLDHHPDWTNVYNTVNVLLSTHDKNNLTEKDILLAMFMEKTFEKFN